MIDIDVYTNYFVWLKDQIHIPPGKTYDDLFNQMYIKEFVWIIPNDDNRIVDGRDLRFEHLGPKSREFLSGVSVLEILVALTRRLEFNAGKTAPWWGWHLIRNLRLDRMSDPLSSVQLSHVDAILEAFVWRTYEPNGKGGFFPLKHAKEDQTKVEIWYQMNAYIIENNYI